MSPGRWIGIALLVVGCGWGSPPLVWEPGAADEVVFVYHVSDAFKGAW